MFKRTKRRSPHSSASFHRHPGWFSFAAATADAPRNTKKILYPRAITGEGLIDAEVNKRQGSLPSSAASGPIEEEEEQEEEKWKRRRRSSRGDEDPFFVLYKFMLENCSDFFRSSPAFLSP